MYCKISSYLSIISLCSLTTLAVSSAAARISCYHGFLNHPDPNRKMEVCNTTGSCYILKPHTDGPVAWYEFGCTTHPCRQGKLANPRSGATQWSNHCCRQSFCNRNTFIFEEKVEPTIKYTKNTIRHITNFVDPFSSSSSSGNSMFKTTNFYMSLFLPLFIWLCWF